MRIHYALGLVLLTLAGCASRTYPTLNTDYANEQWRQQIETDPNAWTRDTDAWFQTGGSSKAELEDHNAPETAAAGLNVSPNPLGSKSSPSKFRK